MVEEGARLAHLVVLMEETGGDEGSWTEFVDEVARLVGLEPSYSMLEEATPSPGGRWLGAVLRAAAATAWPVLVLPPSTPHAPGTTRRPAKVSRAVIASDDTGEFVRGAGLASLRLLRSGVRTTVVVVLTGETAPPMWEGAGHHAAAWRAELERRYGRPHHLEVLSGPPGPMVRARCQGADLVVLLWRQVVDEHRAPVVRAVLDEGVTWPCLLVPLGWVESADAHGWTFPTGAGVPR
jgi:hypothetical protein